jgi:phosphoribosylformimino-5-aminoimidazole carboxamide ribotide isomerase
VLVIPSLDIEQGRSRLVFWPGAASGTGAPTDRPERIVRHFIELGAPLVHLVDLDGARAGKPVNTDVFAAVARSVAVPLQVAGGIDGPEQIRLAFAAGATRVVMPLAAVAEAPDTLRESLAVAGDWLAVGLDPRPDRWREYPWRSAPPSLEELVARLVEGGAHRFVLTHGGSEPDPALLARLIAGQKAEFLVAGGVRDLAALTRLRDQGVAGVILGEALLAGHVDYQAALAAAA